jgi:hypothetical protein
LSGVFDCRVGLHADPGPGRRTLGTAGLSVERRSGERSGVVSGNSGLGQPVPSAADGSGEDLRPPGHPPRIPRLCQNKGSRRSIPGESAVTAPEGSRPLGRRPGGRGSVRPGRPGPGLDTCGGSRIEGRPLLGGWAGEECPGAAWAGVAAGVGRLPSYEATTPYSARAWDRSACLPARPW